MLAPARANDQNSHRASMITNAGKCDAECGRAHRNAGVDRIEMSLALRFSLPQAEAKNIRADSKRYKLFSVDHEGHGRCLVFPIGRKMPQGLAVAFIEGDKISTRVAIE